MSFYAGRHACRMNASQWPAESACFDLINFAINKYLQRPHCRLYKFSGGGFYVRRKEKHGERRDFLPL